MKIIEEIKKRGQEKLLAQEKLFMDVTEEIIYEMDKRGINKTDLAKSLGKSKSFITRILNGDHNMTLRTFSDVCFSIGVTPRVVVDGIHHDEIIRKWETVTPRIRKLENEISSLQQKKLASNRKPVSICLPRKITSWTNLSSGALQ